MNTSSRPPAKPPFRAAPVAKPTRRHLRSASRGECATFPTGKRTPASANQLLGAASIGALLAGLIAAAYLTLRTSCDLETIQWLPRWLEPVANWADLHGYLRNVPAYALLGVPVMFLFAKRRRRMQAFLWLAIFAAGLELLQLFIPTRYFSLGDILLSWVGLGMTWGAGEAVRSGLARWQRPSSRARRL